MNKNKNNKKIKYIFVTGGVLSSLGKGIAASSIGSLLECSGLKITINECYIHCGKALRRSKIWDYETHIKKGTYPSIGKVLVDQQAAPAPRLFAEHIDAS